MDPDKNASSCGGTGRGDRCAQQEQKACCAPAAVRDHSSVMLLARLSAAGLKSASPLDDARPMVSMPGGTFLMGTDYPHGFPQDGEGPVRPVTLSSFQIDTYPLTNEDFAVFVAATGYSTEAERFGWSFVFWAHTPKNRFTQLVEDTVPEWRLGCFPSGGDRNLMLLMREVTGRSRDLELSVHFQRCEVVLGGIYE